MKRIRRKDTKRYEMKLEDLLVTDAVRLLTNDGWSNYCNTLWEHMYNDKLATRLLRGRAKQEEWMAQFTVLYAKRRANDDSTAFDRGEVERAVVYYKLRAMMREAMKTRQ